MKHFVLLCFLVTAGKLRAADSSSVKWHPGHYIFIGKSDLTEELPMLPHFRGVQQVYLYQKLAGTVPMGAAVQKENYSLAAKKRSSWGRVHLGKIVPGDEIPFPVRDQLQMVHGSRTPEPGCDQASS